MTYPLLTIAVAECIADAVVVQYVAMVSSLWTLLLHKDTLAIEEEEEGAVVAEDDDDDDDDNDVVCTG